jgi:hypothetical protein
VALVVNRSLSERNRDAMDDDVLIGRVAAGDDTALRELFCRHAPWDPKAKRSGRPGEIAVSCGVSLAGTWAADPAPLAPTVVAAMHLETVSVPPRHIR